MDRDRGEIVVKIEPVEKQQGESEDEEAPVKEDGEPPEDGEEEYTSESEESDDQDDEKEKFIAYVDRKNVSLIKNCGKKFLLKPQGLKNLKYFFWSGDSN